MIGDCINTLQFKMKLLERRRIYTTSQNEVTWKKTNKGLIHYTQSCQCQLFVIHNNSFFIWAFRSYTL